MEHARNRMNAHLTTDHDHARKWFSTPELNNQHPRSWKIHHIETHRNSQNNVDDKLVYVGCCVSDLSTIHMSNCKTMWI